MTLRRPVLPTGRGLPPTVSDTALRVTFLGNATLLFDDGETQVLTDGFFSRPGAVRTVVCRLRSRSDIVAKCLTQADITRLAAVFVLHSHYDHILDAPAVAAATGAVLVGSDSAIMVGRGAELPKEQLIVVAPGEGYSFGRFTLRPIVSSHVPPMRLAGTITKPLRTPARVTAYRMGTCYSLLVSHDAGRVLVQGSAGSVPGALRNCPADVVYLAVGALSTQSTHYQQQYWNDVVGAVGARRVLPIHWDDFSHPLSDKLVPLPYLFDDFDATLRFLDAKAVETGTDVFIPQVWQAVDPFSGLRSC